MAKKGLVFITKSTFSGASAVNIDNCFSATYTHYLIRRNMSGNADENVLMRLRVSGTDASGADYRYQRIDGSSTTVSGARGTGATSWGWGLGTVNASVTGFCETWVSNPFEAVRTTAWVDTSQTITGNLVNLSLVLAHDLTTSYTGFTASVAAGTLTGSISVWGLVKS